MENLKYLLKEVNLILEKYQQRLANEDTFNLFSVLMKESDEVNLHSKFIETLLNPYESHKMGTKFLSLFLEVVDCKFNYSDNTVETNREQDDIDILLIDYTLRSAVIIENKIYSGDSNHEDEGQLEKYYRIVVENYGIPQENVEVLYLTLDGHEPSEESVATSKKYPDLPNIVKCISYRNDIIKWLKLCAKESYDRPLLRESIVQYIKLLEKMTNTDTSIEERKELMNLIGKNFDNMQSAKLLSDNLKYFHEYSLRAFWNELDDMIKTNGYSVVKDISDAEIDVLTHSKRRKGNDYIQYKFIADNIPFSIYAEWYDSLTLGISKDEKISQSLKNKIHEYNKIYGEDYETEHDFYASYFEMKGMIIELNCSDFSCDDTFWLVSSTYRKNIIKAISDNIKEFLGELNEIG